MTDNVEVFKGRGDARSATLERLAHPSYGAGAIATADLEGQFRIATAIANATEAVPRGYRKQPGAVLLALAWSQQHGLDILTTIQNVAFVEGKAVVDATMQRALAKRAGYVLSITVGASADAGPFATVGVHQAGARLGEATYTMADAETAGLLGKANWRKNQEDMLVARATTRAVRRFAPDVLLGMMVADEVDEMADVVELVTPEPTIVHLEGDTAADGLPAHPEFDIDPEKTEQVADPAIPVADVDDGTAGKDPAAMGAAGSDLADGWWATESRLRADLKSRGITVAAAVREAQAMARRVGAPTPAGTIAAIFEFLDDALRDEFVAWVDSFEVES